MSTESDRSQPDSDRSAQAEREKVIAAIREGLAEVAAGRTKPARAALKTLAKKHGLPGIGRTR